MLIFVREWRQLGMFDLNAMECLCTIIPDEITITTGANDGDLLLI